MTLLIVFKVHIFDSYQYKTKDNEYLSFLNIY